MQYRALGTTGIEVSEIGFGAWGIGGVADDAIAYGPTDDEQSIRALNTALDRGVTFFDTSDLYGFGRSEHLIGRAFHPVRDRVIIASKVGFIKPYGPQDFSKAHILASAEGSLKRLLSEYIDLYQLHNPPIEDTGLMNEALDALTRLKDQGKVRAIGISVRSPEDGLAAIRNFGIQCIQANFNLIDQRAMQNGLLELCATHQVGFICRTPLCFGFLGGTLDPQVSFDERDHRSKWPSEQIAVWAKAHELFRPEFGENKQTAVQFALRFCLSIRGISTVIPGMLTADHVEENVKASDSPVLSPLQLSRIHEIYDKHTFFVQTATGMT